MSVAPLRVVVLGVGHWHATRYLDGLRELGERVVGVGDADLAVARRVAERLNVPGDNDGLALVERLRPNVVVAMATHAAMPARTAALLDHDIGLVLEKPLGRAASEVAPLARAAEAGGRFAAVALINRYGQLWTQLGRLREEGRLGSVIHAHFRVINGPPGRYRRDGVGWMLDPAIAGGGALRNLGIHGADAFRWLVAESEVRVVGATITRAAYGEPVETFAAGIVRSADGTIGTLEAGYTFASMASGGDAESRVMATPTPASSPVTAACSCARSTTIRPSLSKTSQPIACISAS